MNKIFKATSTLIALSLILTVSGCGFSLSKEKEIVSPKIRLSSDILDKIGLEEKWVIQDLGGPKTTIKNMVKNGNALYIFNSNSSLYSINMTTGGVNWEHRFPQKLGNLVQISTYNNRVLIAISTEIFELNSENGNETNHWNLPFTPTTSVARDEKLLFVGATDDRFYCLKLPLLTTVWKDLQSQQPKHKIWLDTRDENGKRVGNVYFSRDNGTVYAAKYDKRELVWSLETAGDIPGCIFDKDQCFVPSTDTALYCVNKENGDIFWKYLSGGKLYATPAVTDKYVYQPVLNKSLVCLERYPEGITPADGKSRLIPSVRWELKSGTQMLSQVGDRVFAVNEAGQMVIMNNKTCQKEYAFYMPNVDTFYSNTEDDMLILANKFGNIMVLQTNRY